MTGSLLYRRCGGSGHRNAIPVHTTRRQDTSHHVKQHSVNHKNLISLTTGSSGSEQVAVPDIINSHPTTKKLVSSSNSTASNSQHLTFGLLNAHSIKNKTLVIFMLTIQIMLTQESFYL